jgi:hypothetical protein
MFGATGINGRYQCVVSLEVEGKFLQIRSIHMLECPAEETKEEITSL